MGLLEELLSRLATSSITACDFGLPPLTVSSAPLNCGRTADARIRPLEGAAQDAINSRDYDPPMKSTGSRHSLLGSGVRACEMVQTHSLT